MRCGRGCGAAVRHTCASSRRCARYGVRCIQCTLHVACTLHILLGAAAAPQQTICSGELLLYHMLQVRAAPACTEIAEVEMTWNEEDEAGQMVYVYRV